MLAILKKNKLIPITLLTIIGAVLHFYNLNWGSPFYFHPDERNIAASVAQLQFPNQMNPHFFAYGSLPIYTIYFTGIFTNLFSCQTSNVNCQLLIVSFEKAILISRFYSAFFATLLIPIIFLIGKKIKDDATGFLAAFLATTSVGFIQFSHFGTFEMWLTFFSVLLFWICLQKFNFRILFLMGAVFGVLMATKISSFVLLPLPITALIFQNNWKIQKSILSGLFNLLKFLKSTILFLLTAAAIYVATNPYVLLDVQSFTGSINYESGVALGTLPVFYTGEFFNTIPIIFQFIKIYPFLLNPLITILFILTFFYFLLITIKHKNSSFLLLASCFLLLFLSQAFLFAKWTRYIVPTLPFVYFIVAIGLSDFLHFYKKVFGIRYLVLSIFVSINILFALSYFITGFVKIDTRVAASQFADATITHNAQILSETYDLGIIPFNRFFPNIALFDFYNLDPTSPSGLRGASNFPSELMQSLAKSDYIILPSQRVLKTRLLNGEKFPMGKMFYEKLLNGSLGFTKIYETPCDVFCKIIHLGNPVFRFEQTANVFDRPTIMIFKKNKNNEI